MTSVTVRVDVDSSAVDITREFGDAWGHSETQRYRRAADVLDSIANDIRRMYPPPPPDDDEEPECGCA